MNPQKELLWSLRVTPRSEPSARISSQIDGSAALREEIWRSQDFRTSGPRRNVGACVTDLYSHGHIRP